MGIPNQISFSELGGELENYRPVEDEATELDATADSKSRAAVAAMTRIPFAAYCRVTGSQTSPGVTVHDAAWGNAVGVKPTISASSTVTGQYVITWPTSVTDNRDQAQTVTFRAGFPSVVGDSPTQLAYVSPSVNVVTLTCFSGSNRDWLTGKSIDIWMMP